MIPIFFSTNDSYVPYLGVALTSLIENTSKNENYRIHILYKNISTYNLERMESLSTSNVEIICVDVSKKLEDKHFYAGYTASTKHISEETFYRLLIPELFSEYKKILYLDCDLIICADVADLFCIDLEEKTIAAVYSAAHWNQERTATISPTEPHEWFNAGVMLVDVEKYIEKGYILKASELMQNQVFEVVDQDLLRLMCYQDTFYLPYEWNLMWHHLQPDVGELTETNKAIYESVCKHPQIIHYTSGAKPWKRPGTPLADFFWEQARKTKFYEEILFQNMGKGVEKPDYFLFYTFPFDQVHKDANTVLYGAGRVGRIFHEQIKETNWCNIVGWTDQNYDKPELQKMGVVALEIALAQEFDVVVICVENEKVSKAIRENIKKLGVPDDKIVWGNYTNVNN